MHPTGRGIEVNVVRRGSRLVLRWVDPDTGKVRQKKTGLLDNAKNRRTAQTQAANLARDIEEGLLVDLVGWEAFRKRYKEEWLSSLRPKSQAAALTALNQFEERVKPRYLMDADESAVSRFTGSLRADKRPNTTVASYLRQLRATFRWAARIYRKQGYRAPAFELPPIPKSKAARGRPITREEFDRVLDAVAGVIGKHCSMLKPEKRERCVKSWKWLLRGYWLSGLRLSEALDLWWDREDRMHVVDLDSKTRKPCIRIYASDQKSNEDQTALIAPDFAALLRRVPMEKRRGRIFRPRLRRGIVSCADTVSHIISEIGRASLVVGDPKKGKHVTAHDLRRSFGTRWAQKTDREVVQSMMRHKSYQTTDRFYVRQALENMAAKLWSGDDSGDSTTKRPTNRKKPNDAKANCQRTSDES